MSYESDSLTPTRYRRHAKTTGIPKSRATDDRGSTYFMISRHGGYTDGLHLALDLCEEIVCFCRDLQVFDDSTAMTMLAMRECVPLILYFGVRFHFGVAFSPLEAVFVVGRNEVLE